MADSKLTALPAAASVTTDDLTYLVDDPAGTPAHKKATVDQVLAAGDARTATLTNKTISGASNTITNVSLTTGVTGTLPIGNGGTGASSLAAGLLKSDGSVVSSVTTSAGISALLSDETGSGALVFANTPTLVTPNIGAATGTSLALGAGFVSIAGAAQAATTGTFRLPEGATFYGRDAGNTADVQLWSWTSGSLVIGGANDLYLYGGSGKTINHGADTHVWKNGIVSATFLTITSSKFEVGQGCLLKIADSSGGQFYTFSPSNLTADRTITLPLMTGNDTMVLNDFAATLTNKTISASSNTISNLTPANDAAANAVAALAIDWAVSAVHTKSLASGANTFTFSNASSGRVIIVRVTSNAGGSTVTWPTVKWRGGAAPTQSTPSKTDVYTFFHDGTSIYGSVEQDMS